MMSQNHVIDLLAASFAPSAWISCAFLGLLFFSVEQNSPCQTLDEFAPKPDAQVDVLIPASDGSVIVSGTFTTIDQQPSIGLAKIDETGVLDSHFASQIHDPAPAIALLPDGCVITAAFFPWSGAGTLRSIRKITLEGDLVTSFHATDLASFADVRCTALQSDEKILFGGSFELLSLPGRTNIVRLNPDGSVDTTFNPFIDGTVQEMGIQRDGKITIGGTFSNVNGQLRPHLARLNQDGSLDPAFEAAAGVGVSAISSLVAQPDDKIIVGGYFGTPSGSERLVRLNRNGSLDSTFRTSAEGALTIALQADGNLIVGNSLEAFGQPPTLYVARLNSDGSPDPSFRILIDTNPIPITSTAFVDPYVKDVTLDPDGRILLGGWFRVVNSAPRTHIARFLNTAPVTTSLVVTNSTILWRCVGPGPAFAQTSFEATTNGLTWAHLGSGEYTNGEWILPISSTLSNATLRALGYVQGGVGNSSAWTLESSIGPSAITVPPASQTREAGATATLEVQVAGTPPFSFQWLKDGQPLNDSGNISGSQTSILRISNILHADSATYSVHVSNGLGTITSPEANLTVLDPVILVQPTNVLVDIGQSALLSVEANGTAPLRFQWQKNGADLVGQTSNLLSLSNIQAFDATNSYQVLIQNQFGASTSAMAQTFVNVAVVDTFNPRPNSTVSVIAEQADKNILVGGCFSRLGGLPCNLLGRVKPDGTLDTSFNAGTNLLGTAVDTIAIFLDGSSIAGGDFTTTDGANCLARFRPDGSRDLNFRASLGGLGRSAFALAIEDDGRILVGGIFSSVNGVACTNLARLNSDGSLDPSFNPAPSGGVLAVSAQPDGAVLVGGVFTSLGGQPCNFLGRLNRSGDLDTNFAPEPDNTVATLGVQRDGKVLAGGYFQTISGFSLADLGRIARLNPDGSIDQTFNPGANGTVTCLSIQTDGAILAAGDFTRLGAVARSGLGRVLANGNVDPAFQPPISGAGTSVLRTAPTSDGTTLIAGSFSVVDGQSRPMIARLRSTSEAASRLNVEGNTVKWLRSGPTAQILRASFSASTNGETYFPLGPAERCGDAWILRNVALPPLASLTANGYVQADGANAWLAREQITLSPSQPPFIVVNDSSFGIISNAFGFNVEALIGQKVIIEGAQAISHWLPIMTNVVETGKFYFLNPNAVPSELYRARLE